MKNTFDISTVWLAPLRFLHNWPHLVVIAGCREKQVWFPITFEARIRYQIQHLKFTICSPSQGRTVDRGTEVWAVSDWTTALPEDHLFRPRKTFLTSRYKSHYSEPCYTKQGLICISLYILHHHPALIHKQFLKHFSRLSIYKYATVIYSHLQSSTVLYSHL